VNKLAVLTACALLAGTASAATVCRIGATGLAFGNYDTLAAAPDDSQANVLVSCTRNGGPPAVTVMMALTEGQYGSSINTRRMANASMPGEFLAYGLYTDAGRSTVWGFSSGVNTMSQSLSIPNKDTRSITFIIYGRIPALQDAAVGSYSDLVQVTVTP
jgi:spore coat protein U-like protein